VVITGLTKQLLIARTIGAIEPFESNRYHLRVLPSTH